MPLTDQRIQAGIVDQPVDQVPAARQQRIVVRHLMFQRDDSRAECVAARQPLQETRVAELAQITIGGGRRVAELLANDVHIDDRLLRAKQVEDSEQAPKAIHRFYILVKSSQPVRSAAGRYSSKHAIADGSTRGLRRQFGEQFLIFRGKMAEVIETPLGGGIADRKTRRLGGHQGPAYTVEPHGAQVIDRGCLGNRAETVLHGTSTHLESLAQLVDAGHVVQFRGRQAMAFLDNEAARGAWRTLLLVTGRVSHELQQLVEHGLFKCQLPVLPIVEFFVRERLGECSQHPTSSVSVALRGSLITG